VDLTATDASVTLDESPLTVSGSVELSGALAQVVLTQKVLDKASLSASNGAAISIAACTGSIVDLTATDASATLDESPLTVSGRVELSGALAQVALRQKVLDKASVSVADGADLTVATCSGTTTLRIRGTATITDSSLSFAAGVQTGLTVQSDGHVDITDSSLSCAAGVGTGLDVQRAIKSWFKPVSLLDPRASCVLTISTAHDHHTRHVRSPSCPSPPREPAGRYGGGDPPAKATPTPRLTARPAEFVSAMPLVQQRRYRWRALAESFRTPRCGNNENPPTRAKQLAHNLATLYNFR
jgi:hypothetical protein